MNPPVFLAQGDHEGRPYINPFAHKGRPYINPFASPKCC